MPDPFALPWALPFLAALPLLRRSPHLRHAPEARAGLVSVIIPARNEAAIIRTVLDSVLATRYEPLEVVVVDDRSVDDTPAIVAEYARRDPRVRLVPGDELPGGWFGKPWACYQGYQAARGEILVFTDADTRHQPALLGHAVGALEREAAGLVTVVTRQRCVTFWERVIMPQIWLLLALRYVPRRVNRARRLRDVIANGQFIMVRRDSYERAGTHRGCHDQVAEDLVLAQNFVRAGEKVHFAYAERLIETRMYTNLGEIAEGWSKNLYLGGKASFPEEPLLRALAPAVLVFAMLFWLIPVAWAGLALTGLLPHLGAALTALGLSAVFWTGMTMAMRIPPWCGPLYPVGAAASLAIVIRSIRQGHRRIRWKGREYKVRS